MPILVPNNRLNAGRPFGCLFAVLLGFSMAFVIFVGTTLGDCVPDSGCHDGDGLRMAKGFLLALPIVIGGAVCVWLTTSFLRPHLQKYMGPVMPRIILVGLTIAAAWFGFRPAFELFFWLHART